jgi:hypothetical protein
MLNVASRAAHQAPRAALAPRPPSVLLPFPASTGVGRAGSAADGLKEHHHPNSSSSRRRLSRAILPRASRGAGKNIDDDNDDDDDAPPKTAFNQLEITIKWVVEAE